MGVEWCESVETHSYASVQELGVEGWWVYVVETFWQNICTVGVKSWILEILLKELFVQRPDGAGLL